MKVVFKEKSQHNLKYRALLEQATKYVLSDLLT